MNRGTWVRCLSRAALAAGASSVLRLSACTGDSAKEFRSVVVPNLQAGVLSILTGLVDGTFAVIEPDNPVESDGA